MTGYQKYMLLYNPFFDEIISKLQQLLLCCVTTVNVSQLSDTVLILSLSLFVFWDYCSDSRVSLNPGLEGTMDVAFSITHYFNIRYDLKLIRVTIKLASLPYPNHAEL